MSKFAFSKKDKTIEKDKFFSWSRNNFYRTSYGSHYTDLPAEPKNVVYSGYAGFIPSMKSSNLYGHGYSPLTRQAFSNPNLAKNTFHLSSTGFNLNHKVHIDHSKNAKSHRYGKQTIENHHPCINTEKWESQCQGTYKHPGQVLNPTYRETDRFVQTAQEFTRNSGFSQNHKQFDGRGWTPEKVLDSDMVRTEYRIQYNKLMPFQREATTFKLRKLKKPEQNYMHT